MHLLTATMKVELLMLIFYILIFIVLFVIIIVTVGYHLFLLDNPSFFILPAFSDVEFRCF